MTADEIYEIARKRQPAPDDLTLPEQLLYTTARNIYKSYQDGIISLEQAKQEKRQSIRNFESLNLKCDIYSDHMKRMVTISQVLGDVERNGCERCKRAARVFDGREPVRDTSDKIHGVLVEVYGEGILMVGDSGIGKSETAVELLKRGHRLIADDAVEIRKVADNSLRGTSPELIRNYIEIRGIGVINVAKLFGMAAIKKDTSIDLVINIVPWSSEQIYDRLGLEDQYMDLLGVKVPAITIPIKPGRNLAVILEVAAMNNRQKKMGYNAALEFTEQINRHFDENVGKI